MLRDAPPTEGWQHWMLSDIDRRIAALLTPDWSVKEYAQGACRMHVVRLISPNGTVYQGRDRLREAAIEQAYQQAIAGGEVPHD